jgi:hypothetical protein
VGEHPNLERIIVTQPAKGHLTFINLTRSPNRVCLNLGIERLDLAAW